MSQAQSRSPKAPGVLPFSIVLQPHQTVPMLAIPGPCRGQTFPDQSLIEPVVPDRVTQDFARLVRDYDLPHLTLHGLRHAHATLMLTSGVHLKIVSERLGHSNIAITADTYSHVLPGLQEAAAEAVEQLLRRADSG